MNRGSECDDGAEQSASQSTTAWQTAWDPSRDWHPRDDERGRGMAQTRAVLFDFGGTLICAEGIASGVGATLARFADRHGLDCKPDELLRAGRAAPR